MYTMYINIHTMSYSESVIQNWCQSTQDMPICGPSPHQEMSNSMDLIVPTAKWLCTHASTTSSTMFISYQCQNGSLTPSTVIHVVSNVCFAAGDDLENISLCVCPRNPGACPFTSIYNCYNHMLKWPNGSAIVSPHQLLAYSPVARLTSCLLSLAMLCLLTSSCAGK